LVLKPRRCTESYNKEQFERHVALDDKLGVALPRILQVASPKGTEIWRHYKALEALHDTAARLS
jgi:hypothetical protein